MANSLKKVKFIFRSLSKNLQNRKYKKFSIGFLLLLLTTFGTVVIHLAFTTQNKSPNETNLPMQVANNPKCVELPYRNRNKYKMVDDYHTQSDLEANRLKFSVGNYEINGTKFSNGSFNLETNKFAYITTTEMDKPSSSSSEVYVYDLVSQQKKLIYRLKPVVIGLVEDEPFYENIKDVGFSDDGRFLGITTTQKLMIYSFDSNNIKTVFYKKREEKNSINGIFSYHSPLFSPNGRYVVLAAGYYEGSGSFLVDIKNQKYKELPYLSYLYGEKVEGWYKDRLVVSKLESTATDSSRPQQEETKVYLVSPVDLSKQYLGVVDGSFGGKVFTDSTYNHYLFGITHYVSDEGYTYCGNDGKPYPWPIRYQSLVMFDLTSGNSKILITMDDRDSDGKKDLGSIWNFNLVDEKIVIQRKHSGGWTSDDMLEISKPQELSNIKY